MNKIETVLVDAGKAIEYPFTHVAKVVAVLGTALKDEPALKAAVVGLVQAAGKVIADGALDVAAKGIDLPGDLATISDLISFFKYFDGTFLAEVESTVKDVEADLPKAA